MTGTRRSKLANKRRKGFLSVMLPWLKRFGISFAVLTVLSSAISWIVLGGGLKGAEKWANNQIMQVTSRAGFSVDDVLVEGRVYTNPETLKEMIAAKKGDPLFSFSPDEARERIRKIDWVKDVHIERRLPGTIYVRLEEKKPLALWQKSKTLELLDEDGKVITNKNLGRFKNLVIVMGEGAPEHAPDLVKNLNAEPALLAKIKAAKWMGERRWDIVFADNITAKLPEGETGLALRRLGEAQEKDAILDKAIVSVDLREEGRMIVQAAPGAAQEYKAGTKSGSNI